MSKSVLVIDTPNNCMECLMLTETHECIMQSKEANYNAYSYTKLQEGCPLRKLPEKMQVCGKYPQPDGIVPSYKIGWNACIDAITGGADAPTLVHDGWIPITEKQPKPLECCLVTLETEGELVVDVAFRYEDKFFYPEDSIGEKDKAITILAWMPLPEPYKPEGVEL